MIRWLHALPLAATVVVAPGCSELGVVELNWVFVDRGGEPFYPGGQFALNRYESSCGLRGKIGDTTVRYDLRLELEICDPACAGGCDDPDCQVVEPRRFSCKTARASDLEVPSAPDPYQFSTRAVIEREDGVECSNLPPGCVAAPGPRERIVSPGLVTDLQVYQIGVDMDGTVGPTNDAAHLDLEACSCGASP